MCMLAQTTRLRFVTRALVGIIINWNLWVHHCTQKLLTDARSVKAVCKPFFGTVKQSMVPCEDETSSERLTLEN